MSVILWMVFGGLTGWLASVLMEPDEETNLRSNIMVGIQGALIGGWYVTLFAGPKVNNFYFSTFLVAILGAIILLWIARSFRRPIQGI